MFRNYLLTAWKVFMRRKLFTAINLLCIVLTLVVLLIVTAQLQSTFYPTGVEGKSERFLQMNMFRSRHSAHGGVRKGPLGYKLIDQYLKPLKGAGAVSAFFPERISVYQDGRISNLGVRHTDAEYWKILDFKLVSGRLYNADDVARGRMVAVLNRSTARRLFPDTDAIGQKFNGGGQVFTVIGVVEDESGLNASSEMWVPVTSQPSSDYRNELFGPYQVMILAHTAQDLPALKQEILRVAKTVRYDDPNKFNVTDMWGDSKLEWYARNLSDSKTEEAGVGQALGIVVGLMLLFMALPALNLINLNVGRILERSSEIGVRKAFGASSAQLVAQLAQQTVDLVLQDMNFSLHTSGEEGMRLLADIKQARPSLPVLLMTAWGSIALAVRGVQAGAANFFTKPWDNVQLVALIRATLETAGPGSGDRVSRQALDAQFNFSGIVGEHPRLLKVLSTIGQVAATRAPVLILGESGCGKELIADAIHRNSPRAARAIVKINMGAITPSLFESEMFGHVRGAFTDAKSDRKGYVACAHEGTLFLDEIGELNRSDQVKLLRVLQDQTYQPVGASRTDRADFRVVAATNRELAALVAAGEFREDLFYRLNLITIRLPPLRERRSDIALLARHIIGGVSASYGLEPATIAPQALEWLSAQPWPGNIRQLNQTLERTLLLVGRPELRQADFIAAEQHEHGGAFGQRLGVDGMTLEQVERHMIAHALDQHQGNISRVAKVLGLSRTALYRRLERHGLGGAADETGP